MLKLLRDNLNVQGSAFRSARDTAWRKILKKIGKEVGILIRWNSLKIYMLSKFSAQIEFSSD